MNKVEHKLTSSIVVKTIVWAAVLILLIFGASYLSKSKQSMNNSSFQPSSIAKADQSKPELYTNTTYGFTIATPNGWHIREIDKTGAAFRPGDKPNDYQYEYISVTVMDKPANLTSTLFDQYVKVAATSEIQNYQSLSTIQKVTTDSGVVGYETTWNVLPMYGMGTTPTPGTTVSLPITYFPMPDGSLKKSIQVSLSNKDYVTTYNQMIQTFHYTSGQQ